MATEQSSWGKVAKINVTSPYNLVSKFANEFNDLYKKSEMICRVSRQMVEPRTPLLDLDSIYSGDIDPMNKEKSALVKMYVEVPSLDNYSLLLIKVTYTISQLYPCELTNCITKKVFTCETAEVFEKKLTEELKSESIQKRLSILYSQVED